MLPFLNFDHARFPIIGGLLQKRAGTARHDAVAWGFARGADRLGVDLIQNCEVTGIRRESGVVTGVETTKRFHRLQQARRWRLPATRLVSVRWPD
jgi:glycine/D-amino acid oxidase-like deaminating enzyme